MTTSGSPPIADDESAVGFAAGKRPRAAVHALRPALARAASALKSSDLQGPESPWHLLLDRMGCSLAVYDAERRLVTCNDEFRRLYRPIARHLVPGLLFEELITRAVHADLVPQARGCEQAWIDERVRSFPSVDLTVERLMADGHWRRITETPLADRGVLSFSTDITELVGQRLALQHALEAASAAHERLHDAVEALPAGFELWDADDRLVLCNQELRRMYPAIADAVQPGARYEDLVRADHAADGFPMPNELFDDFLARRAGERRCDPEPSVHATGAGRWYRVYHRRTPHGALVGVRLDVTELRNERAAAERARQDAELARRQLSDAIEALPEGFTLFDADDRLVMFNARCGELYRESADVIRLGASFEDMLRHGLARGQYPQAVGQEEAWLAAQLHRHRHPGGPEFQQLPGNRWLRIDERVTRDNGVAGVRAEVTELVRREQQLTELNRELQAARAQLEMLSETDALTGIANRRHFDRRLSEEWSHVVRHHMPLGLLMVDIDHFKRFNDHHGHEAGDECLRRVAAVLEACAGRPTDVVARYGGEEFTILLPHLPREGTVELAQRCVAAVDAAAIAHGDSPVAAHVTISVGVAWTRQGASPSARRLLRDADEALYRAKAGGRHQALSAP